MKKVTLMFLLAASCFASFAQDYDKVRTDMIVLKKPEDAKTELDKVMANPKLKDKTTGLYWTFAIYSMYYGDSALAAKHPGSDSLALQALYQYEQLDTSLKALKENSNIVRDFDYIRAASFNKGVMGFNNHDWPGAFKGFSLTVKADNFMERHRLFASPNFVDTNSYLYAGYAAQNSGNLPEAVNYYKTLVDRGIVIPSRDFENSIYYTMLGFYVNNNDQNNFKKYAPVIKGMLPKFSDKIDQMAMQNMTANTGLTDLLAKYKQEGNLTEAQYASYADAFSQPDKGELAKLDSAKQVQVRLAAADAYSKAFISATSKGDVQEVTIGKNASSTPAANLTGIYAFDAAVLYTGVYQDLADRFFNLKGGDASFKAKRDETEKMQSQYGDSVIVWATNAYNTYKSRNDLSKRELNYVKLSVQNLSNIYGWKRDRSQGVNPKDYDKYDALYKQFDAETDKYEALYKAAPAKTN
jgi:hypothetical protein